MDAKATKALAAAKRGDLAAIDTLFKRGADAAADRYRHLVLAADFGSTEAATLAHAYRASAKRGALEDIGLAHLDLGEWYLTGKHGLSVDLSRARAHLEETEKLVPSAWLDEYLPRMRRRLKPEAAAVLDAVWPTLAKPKRT